MATTTAERKGLPLVAIVIGAVMTVALIVGLVYLSWPAHQETETGPSAEAKAYLANLQLADVDMKASENFMKQQVVEIDGKISNRGHRTVRRIDVECIFAGVDGKEVHRERVSVVNVTGGTGFAPNETRSFRLPFDSLPDDWNQAMPRLVISQITFIH